MIARCYRATESNTVVGSEEYVITRLVDDNAQSFRRPLLSGDREQPGCGQLDVFISLFFFLSTRVIALHVLFRRTHHTAATHATWLTVRTADRVVSGSRAMPNSGHEIFHDNAVRGPVARTRLINEVYLARILIRSFWRIGWLY